MLNHLSIGDLLVVAFLVSLALIVAVAAYLDFGVLKSFRVDAGLRRSREDILTHTRSKIL